ncbi:MAG: hypothetical protein IIA14_06380 [SAR324 cluster bacterium]|nr:hypothetical protein [SAR324 cluster bacterium]
MSSLIPQHRIEIPYFNFRFAQKSYASRPVTASSGCNSLFWGGSVPGSPGRQQTGERRRAGKTQPSDEEEFSRSIRRNFRYNSQSLEGNPFPQKEGDTLAGWIWIRHMAYEEFSASSPAGGKTYHCRFSTLMTGISLRHSDTVDVKFLVDGKGVVIALPHSAFAEHERRTGRALTDAMAIQMAGLFLKELLEKGEAVEEPFLTPAPKRAIELAGQAEALVSG